MNRKTQWFTLAFVLAASAACAAAPETAPAAVAPAAPANTVLAAVAANQYFSASVLASALGLAIAAFGGAIGQGWAVSKAVEGIARQPEAANNIRAALILGLALIESLVIYALVVALILIFLNPFAAQLVK
jgi:F-type H+-transporting ATPase subunit c